MHEQSNQIRSTRGAQYKSRLVSLFAQYKEAGLIKKWEENVKFCHDGFPMKQYTADFILYDYKNSPILVFASTSMRSDRMKKYYYNAFGIRNHTALGKTIIGSIYIAPDQDDNTNAQEKASVKKLQASIDKQLATGQHTSIPLSTLLFESDVEAYLENLKEQYLQKLALEAQDEKDSTSALTPEGGRRLSYRGTDFEKDLADALQTQVSTMSLSRLSLAQQASKQLREHIANELHVNVADLCSINATQNIPLIPGKNGYYKTDIHIKVRYRDASHQVLEHYFNVSCKVSTKLQVSCHEGDVNALIAYLEQNNKTTPPLVYGLQAFQASKSWSAIEWGSTSTEIFRNDLDAAMPSVMDVALKGVAINRLTTRFDSVDFIVFADPSLETNEQVKVFRLIDYIERLLSSSEYKKWKASGKGFGKPLSWTYPSGKGGYKIQLKTPTIRSAWLT